MKDKEIDVRDFRIHCLYRNIYACYKKETIVMFFNFQEEKRIYIASIYMYI